MKAENVSKNKVQTWSTLEIKIPKFPISTRAEIQSKWHHKKFR